MKQWFDVQISKDNKILEVVTVEADDEYEAMNKAYAKSKLPINVRVDAKFVAFCV